MQEENNIDEINNITQNNNILTFSNLCYVKQYKKWEVEITINGKKKIIGFSYSFNEAVKLRTELELRYYKEFQEFQNELDQLE